MAALPGRRVYPSSIESTLFQVGNENKVFLLDGGTGEELIRQGVPYNSDIWSANAIVDDKYHSSVKNVHRSFLEAGSNAVTTNSYGLVPGVGFRDKKELQRLANISGQLAQRAVEEFQKTQPGNSRLVFVLGSLGPLVETYRPDLIMEHEEAVAYYESLLTGLWTQVDAFIGETLSTVEESKQIVDALARQTAVREDSKSLLISYTLDGSGTLRSGETTSYAIHSLLNYANEKNVNGTPLLLMRNCSRDLPNSSFPSYSHSPINPV